MKQQGIFSSISDSYWNAGGAAIGYVMFQAPWLLKLPLLPLAVAYGLVMAFFGTLFAILMIFDVLGLLADTLKKYVFNLLDRNRKLADADLTGFLFRPLLMALSIPLLILALIVPRFSSSVAVEAAGEVSSVLSGPGAMAKTAHLLLETLRRTWRYALRNLFSSQLAVALLLVLVALVHTAILVPLAVIFFLLAPIDWLSALVDHSRAALARYLSTRGTRIRYSGWGFLFTPIWMVVIAPFIIALLIVPKFSAHMMMD